MRVVMIHAVAESMSPTKGAFQEVFPEAELVNLLDEGLFLDFGYELRLSWRRRMTQLICYSAEHGGAGYWVSLFGLYTDGGDGPGGCRCACHLLLWPGYGRGSRGWAPYWPDRRGAGHVAGC